MVLESKALLTDFGAYYRVWLAIPVICCICAVTLAQQRDLVKGSIVDSIGIGPGVNESFALYIPRNFNYNHLSPVVFIFDPAARGREGLLPFLAASEKYGYILVCSNNSRNGPYDRNYEISNRLFKKVFDDFNIDPQRIYTAGFSGGARLASSIAVLSGQIQGVIACGAGFSPNEMAVEPGFSYAAIIGNMDFNYGELVQTRVWLNKLEFPNELFEFKIRHQWPDSSQVLKAFKWLQLESYRKGLLPVDSLEVSAYYREMYDDGRLLEDDEEYIPAVAEYERLLRNFDIYFEVDSVRRKIQELKGGASYKEQERRWLSSLDTETDLIQGFQNRLSGDLKKKNPKVQWWQDELDRLRSGYGKSDRFGRSMLERVLSAVSAMAYETANSTSDELSAVQQSFCYDLNILVYPERPYPYFRQIELQVAMGHMDEAVQYLEKLIKNGPYQPNELKDHRVVRLLSGHIRFKELIPPQ